ncbi:MAG: NAD(P)-dependent oxidoreductase [Chloroflexota bacterium]|nr:NAD(P)-dependent oxidoreductase [Chloroflexota bacterium]MEC8958395.1 NAD(P)-dependent oxidoreductase [Chloroflexota bacterium]MED5404539.1 NAD(P)-dependent oxidoreductase [Chloroflexota bacterium]MEE3246348.1 NAD(P)-dependent oxidoreductase [Chloroflexota bacterium]MEE3248367.1 NAD(P)-dependent oxidoreductase [Chloroflexota bacterium]|tara:strand:+ start:347 stop:1327 length:981 start_codon:yes stop_codon:yes gene_type:complete
MATLVTGGTGFVGANIVKDLANNGHDVVSFDINGPDQLLQQFIGEAASKITFIQGDIVDSASIQLLGQGHQIDKIVHAAVYTVNRTALEIERSRDVIAINLEGTANLLELARTQKVTRFVYVSSGAAYGTALPSDQTLNEETPPAPDNLYGITKFSSEMITRRYGELHGLSTVSVRLSTPYGPMERVTGHRAVMSVFYDWIGRAVRGTTISPQDLAGGRDYIYISDIANGIRTVLDATSLPHNLYNITTGIWVTYQQILDAVVELSPETVFEVPPLRPADSVGEGYSRGPLSGHRLFEDLGWTPKFELKEGLADYFKWRKYSGFLD